MLPQLTIDEEEAEKIDIDVVRWIIVIVRLLIVFLVLRWYIEKIRFRSKRS